MSWPLIVNGDAMRPVETICQALVGQFYREEHVFALSQAIELYDVYQTKVAACDKQIEGNPEAAEEERDTTREQAASPKHRSRQPNAPSFDAPARRCMRSSVSTLPRSTVLGHISPLKLVGAKVPGPT